VVEHVTVLSKLTVLFLSVIEALTTSALTSLLFL